jgi:toxin ParE1/3/4
MPTAIQSPQARLDIDQIVTFISRDSLPAASHWLDNMKTLFGLLATQPFMGAEIDSRRYGKIRRHAHGNYVVYFRGINDGVEIVRVLHGARDHQGLI